MDVMEEAISNCRRSVADRDETQHDLPPRLCNAAVRPVKAEAVAEHQGRFSAPTGLVEVRMSEADVVGRWKCLPYHVDGTRRQWHTHISSQMAPA